MTPLSTTYSPPHLLTYSLPLISAEFDAPALPCLLSLNRIINVLRAGQKLGKYRLLTKLSVGTFATVFRAFDTLEGVYVALKIPHPNLMNKESLADFTKEVKLAARLDHPNILALKTADYIDGQLVIAFPLGEQSLDDRLAKRMPLRTALDLGEQLLRALAFAHENRVIHCDVKPDNLLLFKNNRLRLTDFGISKIAHRTISASGAGTVGYMAPEQAMGRPSARSDVFAAGIVLWQMFSGNLPEWPFDWPPPAYERMKRRVHPDMIAVFRRAMQLKPSHRYEDGRQMLAAYLRAKPKALKEALRRTKSKSKSSTKRDWKAIRQQQFLKQFGKELQAKYHCHRCHGPVAEAMHDCPWCGTHRKIFRDETEFPAACTRCHRGLKLDWRYCPWCYGPGFEPLSNRWFTDRRYTARCRNRKCPRKDLMPFMRYCPWCHTKVRQPWKIAHSNDTCDKCGWGVLREFWSHCPWCTAKL